MSHSLTASLVIMQRSGLRSLRSSTPMFTSHFSSTATSSAGLDADNLGLDGDTVAEFKSRGWCAVPDFWEAHEIDALRNALSLLQVRGRLANVATDGDGETHTEVARNLQLCPLSPELPIFRSLPFVEKVGRSVAQLLCNDADDVVDESVYCYLSQTFWKPAQHGLGTGYHQDNAYFEVPDARRGCAMWTAIHDATVANGCLHVADGYAMEGAQSADNNHGILDHRRDLTSDHHITCVDVIDLEREVAIEMKAGGVVFFNYNVPHRTGPNETDTPRAGVAYHFLHGAHYRERAFPLPEDCDYRTPVVHGRGNTQGAAEYGENVASWQGDVADMLAVDLEAERVMYKSEKSNN
eukprot:TRINITY_DN44530_c0_g1_i1.p1 TRINITY_DN44530_c0_g1~~TRINITY_DN44530_c0_g1_i1.p1  ORF type:complete len:352 (+),score=29.42 TRINITY_DN44530_c0_g1_i1:201-1256(+)